MNDVLNSEKMGDTVVDMLFGSHLYGLSHADSDEDFKGVLMPTCKQIIMQQADFHISKSTGSEFSKNGAGDVDSEFFSLQKFVKLAIKGETVSIDMLHAPDDKINETSDVWKELVSMRCMFYTKDMRAYVGYVRKQAAKYGVKGSRIAVLKDAIAVLEQHNGDDGRAWKLGGVYDKLPYGEHAELVTADSAVGVQTFYQICGRKFDFTNNVPYVLDAMTKILNSYGARAKQAESNEGIDWKAISHALRAGYQARGIYANGGFEYPLEETAFLMDVKMGRLDWMSDVQPILDALVEEVDVLAAKSDYPDKVDVEFWNNWVYKKHLQIVKEEL